MTMSLDAISVECGGTVSGTAEWPGGGDAEVALGWSTSGDGAVDRGTVDTATLAVGEGRFALTVPPDGPMTFAGKLISVRWEVTLRAGDTSESVEVTVLPRGGLTVWVRTTAPPPET